MSPRIYTTGTGRCAGCRLALILFVTTLVAPFAFGPRLTSSAEAVAELPAEAVKTLADLGSDRFDTRRAAQQSLATWLGDPQRAASLAAEIHRRILDPELPVDLRVQLDALLVRHPGLPIPPPPTNITQAQLDETVWQLDAGKDSARAAARAQLDWYVRDPKLACQMLAPLAAAVMAPGTSRESTQSALDRWEAAHGVWALDTKLDRWLSAVSTEQISAWIRDVAKGPADSPEDRQRLEMTKRQLIDLLARDEYRQKTTAQLTTALKAAQDWEVVERLQDLLNWTRPAMAAENWLGNHHRSIQHLIIDLPQSPEDSRGTTHFDRIDELTAHCVSGVTLTPGDYPVGIAFAHKNRDDGFYVLWNMPTTRRRLQYDEYVKRPEAERLAELSERTLDTILKEKRHLDLVTIRMFRYFTPKTVSQFAPRYFQAVADAPLGDGRPTEHDEFCGVLAQIGTNDAQAGLEKEAEARGPRPPNTSPMAQLASLAIAGRDPWPKVNDWLAQQVSKDDLLYLQDGSTADLGATAGALLVSRLGALPRSVFPGSCRRPGNAGDRRAPAPVFASRGTSRAPEVVSGQRPLIPWQRVSGIQTATLAIRRLRWEPGSRIRLVAAI